MTIPSFGTHVALLWRLRLAIERNRHSRASALWVALSFAASSAPAVGTAVTFYALVVRGAQVDAALWPDFMLRLVSFVTTGVWVAWPVLSAGVDDHSEVSRYGRFPISSLRLMAASMVAGLFEPRALVLYGPLVGTSLGYVVQRPESAGVLPLLALLGFVLFNMALSRAALHAMLTVLRQPRSAELLGSGFFVFLVVASFIPPVDTSWLSKVQQVGVTAVPSDLLRNATLALGRVPTGFYAHAVAATAAGAPVEAFADVLALLEWALVALVVAWGLLLEFHRAASSAGVPSEASRRTDPFARTRTVFSTLVVRELLDLWNNPRARLLASVPFVLAVLLKLLSARALLVALAGGAADAWLVGALALYGAVVMTSTFSQNAFGYDGQGFGVFAASPVDLGVVLAAKNLVHGAAGLAMAVLVVGFQALFAGGVGLVDGACAVAGAGTVVFIVLAAGNGLSTVFPIKFHADLKRRDRLPFVASMLGVAAASLGAWPWVAVLRAVGAEAPGWAQVLVLMLAMAGGVAVYAVSWPAAAKHLRARRHAVLQAVTRE